MAPKTTGGTPKQKVLLLDKMLLAVKDYLDRRVDERQPRKTAEEPVISISNTVLLVWATLLTCMETNLFLNGSRSAGRSNPDLLRISITTSQRNRRPCYESHAAVEWARDFWLNEESGYSATDSAGLVLEDEERSCAAAAIRDLVTGLDSLIQQMGGTVVNAWCKWTGHGAPSRSSTY
ncbi:hypothetical protein PENFLA_c010G02427 [Penicillium flavigenum]|uniref:Uncharacterized protein n=1 Tax=Penicillium flavigenum TaxID=254877 RepID=A0A1V6TDC9_9EURO|nr:hypothetical protein PENFLA_c010G02427 [Penicillium flavigenum]